MSLYTVGCPSSQNKLKNDGDKLKVKQLSLPSPRHLDPDNVLLDPLLMLLFKVKCARIYYLTLYAGGAVAQFVQAHLMWHKPLTECPPVPTTFV